MTVAREYLVLAPGRAGAAGTGKFWDDVWALQVPAESGTAASITDTVLSTVGRNRGEGKWIKVEMGPRDEEDGSSVGQ